MRIALISYEFPPDTAHGGIATYVNQVANLLNQRNHDVEVFSASGFRNESVLENGILIHRVYTSNRESFRRILIPIFAERHKFKKFDIVESPEYNADAFEIQNHFKELPIIVKLHTPSFLIDSLNSYGRPRMSPILKVRILIAAWRRLKKPNLFWKYYYKNDVEYIFTKKASAIVTPSISLGYIVSKKWKIPRNNISCIPYPFMPSSELLSIPLEYDTNTITYIGRLEIRKGVIVLAKIVTDILIKFPKAKFKFVGQDMQSQYNGITVKQYIIQHTKMVSDRVIFVDQVAQKDIYQILNQTDICIFPSIWENFPNVCLEAMSAGRAIVASLNGGMSDMLASNNAGILVNPLSEESIKKALISLIEDRGKIADYGRRARLAVVTKYNADKIGTLMEENYLSALKIYSDKF